MKKILLFFLAIALIGSILVCSLPVLADSTFNIGDVLKPENLGTSINNGYFKLGYFASTQSGGKGTTNLASKFYYDTVSSVTEQHSYYGQMYTYSDSQNPINNTTNNKSKAGAINNDITLTVDTRARVPFIEFTAPVSATYSFTMFLSKSATYAATMTQDYLFRAYKATTEISGYTPGNFKKANSSTTIGEGSNHSNVFTFSVTLAENEKLYLVPDSGNNTYVEGWNLGVEELSATVTVLTPASCQHAGEFTYGKTETEHWKICSECNEEIESSRVSHNFDNGACICGKEAHSDDTVSVGDVLNPENLGTSVNNGYFKFGYFASTQSAGKGVINLTAKGYYNNVTSATEQHSYYGQMYTYNDSQNPITDTSTNKSKIGAVNRDIAITVDNRARVPFIEFTAPVSGIYSFNMFLSKSASYAASMTQDFLFRVYKDNTEITGYAPGNFRRANSSTTIGEGSNHSNAFTFTVTLSEGDKIYLVPDSGENTWVEGWVLGVEELSATVTALTPPFCQHAGEFTYGKTETEHWKICSECNEEIESSRVSHNFDNGDCICGKEAPSDDTVSVGDVFRPENLGTSINNGCFKLGYFASTQSGGKGATNFASKFYYDTVSSATEQHSYYGQMYTYSDSQNPISDATANKSKAGAINNDIVLTVDSRARVPFIEFTAPAEGTYTFSMYLSKSATYAELMNADFYFRVYKGESEIKGYTPGNFKKANSSTTIGEGSNHSNVFTFTVALTENEKIYLIPDEGYNASVNGWVLGVEELSATVTAVGACEHNYENGFCTECDLPCYHEDGELHYTVNGDKHTGTYDCCGKKEADNVSHDFSVGDCVCGAKKPAPQTGDNIVSVSIALVIASVTGIVLIDRKRRSI